MSIPKLTKIGLQNFKAFKDKEEFEIKPITLVYGYNSSGKSSFLHSLLFLDEFMRSGNVDVHYPTLGGGEVDLGGYKQFVNRAEISKFGPSSFKTEFEKEGSHYHTILKVDNLGGRKPRLYQFIVRKNDEPWLELTADEQTLDEDCHKLIQCGDMDEDALAGWRVHNFGSLDNELRLTKNEENVDDADGYSLMIRHVINDELRNFKSFYGSDRIHYLGPLRSIPNRTELAWGTPGGNSDMEPWNRIRNEPEVREKVNDVLAEIFPQKNGKPKYRFDVLEFGQTDQAEGAVPNRGYYKNLSHDSSKIRDDILEKVSLIQQGDSDLSLSDIQEDLDKLEELEQLQARVQAEKPKSLKKEKVIRKLVLLDLSNDENPIEVSLQDIGVGVGHLIPLLVAEIAAPPGTTLITDSAEVYLHPKQHAIEADTCIRTAMMGGVCHIRETHSEFFLQRILRRIGEANLKRKEGKGNEIPKGLDVKADDVAIYFVLSGPEEEDSGNYTKVRKMRLGQDGSMLDKWLEGFFAEKAQDIYWCD